MAGAIAQKLPGDDKAIPVTAIYFDKAVKWPGVAGAADSIRVGRPDSMLSQNAMWADNIFLYKGEFIINGRQYMPKTAGCIKCYEF